MTDSPTTTTPPETAKGLEPLRVRKWQIAYGDADVHIIFTRDIDPNSDDAPLHEAMAAFSRALASPPPPAAEAVREAMVWEPKWGMSLTRLVDGVSTYTLRFEDDADCEFDNTENLYEYLTERKAKARTDRLLAALTAAPHQGEDDIAKGCER